MHAVPAIAFLAAAVLCSLVSRVLLINAAYAVSTRWLFAVLFAPFGPLVFGVKFPEPAKSSWYFRMIVPPLVILFFLDGGNASSIQSLKYLGKPIQAAAGDTNFHLPVPAKVVAAPVGKPGESTDPDAAAQVKARTAAKSSTPAPVATPSAAVAAAISAMPAAPKVLSPAERIDANRREFERLAEWYDTLKHERGYLRKGDTAAVEAYNVEAAQYQAALQLAKSEQTAIARLTARK